MDEQGHELGSAIIASMRKLLGAMVSVARTKTAFVPQLAAEATTG